MHENAFIMYVCLCVCVQEVKKMHENAKADHRVQTRVYTHLFPCLRSSHSSYNVVLF